MPGRFTQLDRFLAGALACLLVAVLPVTPDILAGLAGAIMAFVFVGLIWAIAIRPAGRGYSAIAGGVVVIAAVFGSGIIGGLLLNFLPSGLNRTNWLIYLVVVCVIGYLVARIRGQHRLFRWDVATGLVLPSGPAAVKLGAVLVLLVATVVISVQSTYAKDKPFTELWLLPNNPTNSPVHAIDATLGVKSRETSAQQYTLVFDSGAQVVTSKVTLGPNEEMTKKVYIEGDEATATLYLGDSAGGEPYRKVWVARR